MTGMKTVGYATTAVAIALSIVLSLLAHRSIEEYALVGTGETFRAAYVCLLGAAFFLGVAVPGIVRIVWKRKKEVDNNFGIAYHRKSKEAQK